MSIDSYRAVRQTLLQEEQQPAKLSRTSLLSFFGILIGLFVVYVTSDGRVNPWYSALHFLIIGVSLLHIMWVRRFNLGSSYSLFALFFFGVIPLFEYRFGITYNDASIPKDSSYITAAAFALLASVCFYFGYGLKRGSTVYMDALQRMRFVSVRHRQLSLWTTFFVLAALATFILFYYKFSPHAVMFRGYGEEQQQSAMGNSFVTYIARPLFLNLVLMMMLAVMRRPRVSRMTIFVLFCSVVIFVSPVGIPRSLAGALYIPLLMMVFLPRHYSKYGVICVIIFAILFAAPLADVFRSINHTESVDLGENYNLAYIFSGHFDAFHNFAQVIELDYRSEGWQVVGILLFWVPRAIWSGKPQGTSFDFADFAGYEAHNISFSLPAEFYVDYGVGGIIFGMFVVGMIYRRVDLFLSKPKRSGSVASYIFTIGHMELSILGLYLVRGSVLSSFAYTVGLSSTLVGVNFADRLFRGLCNRSLAQPEHRADDRVARSAP
jgi:oligosaccharide repeat unit polymerase